MLVGPLALISLRIASCRPSWIKKRSISNMRKRWWWWTENAVAESGTLRDLPSRRELGPQVLPAIECTPLFHLLSGVQSSLPSPTMNISRELKEFEKAKQKRQIFRKYYWRAFASAITAPIGFLSRRTTSGICLGALLAFKDETRSRESCWFAILDCDLWKDECPSRSEWWRHWLSLGQPDPAMGDLEKTLSIRDGVFDSKPFKRQRVKIWHIREDNTKELLNIMDATRFENLHHA